MVLKNGPKNTDIQSAGPILLTWALPYIWLSTSGK